MRYDIKVGERYQGWIVLAIHHDQGRSIILGECVGMIVNGEKRMTYVVGTISDETCAYREWYNGYYSDDCDKAHDKYVSCVTSRMV